MAAEAPTPAPMAADSAPAAAAAAAPRFKPITWSASDFGGAPAAAAAGAGASAGAAAAAAGTAGDKSHLLDKPLTARGRGGGGAKPKADGAAVAASAAEGKACHLCGQPGHLKRDCPDKAKGDDKNGGGGGRGGGGKGGDKKDKACYICGRTNHLAKECRDKPQDGGAAGAAARGGGNPAVANGPRVYVGNLSYDTTWQRLKDHFRTVFGAEQIVRCDVLASASGRSKGSGIVELATAADAQMAIAKLTDTQLDGRAIFVREDREAIREAVKEAVADRYSGTGRSSGTRDRYDRDADRDRDGDDDGDARASRRDDGRRAADEGRALYVGNLAWGVTWQNLKDLFHAYGDVERADVVSDGKGRSKGFGVVIMASARAATKAIDALNNTDYEGRSLIVREDKQRDR